jgi:hypothetical protein
MLRTERLSGKYGCVEIGCFGLQVPCNYYNCKSFIQQCNFGSFVLVQQVLTTTYYCFFACLGCVVIPLFLEHDTLTRIGF